MRKVMVSGMAAATILMLVAALQMLDHECRPLAIGSVMQQFGCR